MTGLGRGFEVAVSGSKILLSSNKVIKLKSHVTKRKVLGPHGDFNLRVALLLSSRNT
jgi:hypothetical protein